MSKPMFARLTSRFQVRTPVQTPASDGGADLEYSVRAAVWGNLEPISTRQKMGIYVRDAQREDVPTHVATFRVNEELGITRVKLTSPDFLYLETREGEGRSFRILSVTDVGERNSYLEALVMEIETQAGTDGLVSP